MATQQELCVRIISLFLRKSWHLIGIAIITGLISGISNAGALVLISTALGTGAFQATPLIVGFVILGLVTLLSRASSEIVLIHLSQGAIFELRLYLSRQILATPLRQLEALGAPKLLAALTDDVLVITNTLQSIPAFCINVASLIVFLIYLGWVSWVALIGILGFVIMGVITYQLFDSRAAVAMQRARQDQNTLFEHLRALTDGVKELKLHYPRRMAFLTELLQPTARSFQRNNTKGMAMYTIASSWTQGLMMMSTGLVVFALPLMPGITPTMVISSAFTLIYLVGPVIAIVDIVPGFARARVAMHNIEHLGLSNDIPATTELEVRPATTRIEWQMLELVNVTHTYHRDPSDHNFQLGPINLSFQPGTLVFLIGGNGSGKTTLTKLLTGLYVPNAGEIYLDKQLITDETRETYRQMFTTVLSDFYLFDRLLGVASTDRDAQAHHYLAQLELSDKLTIANGVFSTTALSQGQRKRLALLTAYLEDRPFYIFDEWAADQDPIFKDVFYTQLLPELRQRGKTVLVITHDDRYYHIADQLIKLDYGKLISLSNGATPIPTAAAPHGPVVRSMG